MNRLATITSLSDFRERKYQPQVKYVTYEELSGRLHRSVRQLQRDRRAGMPAALEFGATPGHGRVLFVEDQVIEWFRRRRGGR